MPVKSLKPLGLNTLVGCTVISGVLLAQATVAAEWETGAGVAVGAYYSDNICLAPSGEQGKWVATARPDVSVQGRGARGNVSLDAAAEYNSLGNSGVECTTGQGGNVTNRESVIPSVRFASDYELIDDWLELQATAFAGRNAINPFAPGGTDGFGDRDNSNITYRYEVGAVVQRRLAQAADMRLSYTYDEQFNSVGQFGDSSEDRARFDLDTIPGSGRISAGVGANYSNVSYEESDNRSAFDNELSSAEFRSGLQLATSWQVNALVGEEWNEFTSTSDDIDGSYWDVGVRWTPNSRIEVNVGSGERFFGSTPRADIRYRHKRSELSASYARTLTFPRNLRAADNGFDDPLLPLPGDLGTIEGLPTFTGNSLLLDERVSMQYVFTARRSTLTLAVSESQQTRFEDDSEATFRQVSIAATRQLSNVLSANARLGWDEREGQGEGVGIFGEQSDTWRLRAGLSHRVGNDTTISINYDYITRNSGTTLNEYDENRISFSVRHGF